MPKAPTDTRDQLRALIHTHAQTHSAVAATGQATVPGKPAEVSPVQSIPAVPTQGRLRQSMRLLPSELAKVNRIIKNTIQQTGERVTGTDVLRIGLSKLAEAASITPQELQALRASDGRRFKMKG